jgi:tyrosine-protein kinase Etk/Wzc
MSELSGVNGDNPGIKPEKINYDGSYLLMLMHRYKWIYIILIILTIVASVLLTLSMPNWYKASVNAVPSKSQGSLFNNMFGGISSTLKEFGMTKLAGGGGGETYDFIVLMQSRTIKDSLINRFNLSEEYEIADSMKSQLYGALDNNMEVSYEKEGNYYISILSKDKYKVVEMINYFVETLNELAQNIAHEDASLNRIYLENRILKTDSVIATISDSISTYSKKNFLFSLEEQAKASSSAYAELKAELIRQETLLEMNKMRYGENDYYTKMSKELVDNLKNKLDEIKNKPGFAGDFALKNATGVGIEYMRLLAEFETFTKVKSLLLPMLEEAKLDETRNTQSLIIVDPPIPADRKAKPKRSLIVAGSVIGIFVLITIFIVLLDGYRNFRKKYRLLADSK